METVTHMRTCSSLLLTFLIMAMGATSMPTIALAQGIGSGSCPQGTTPRQVPGTIRYDCVSPDGTVVGQSDILSPVLGYKSFAPVSCTPWWNFFSSFGTCGGRFIAVWLGGIMVSISGWILELAGVLFNASLEFTTMSFDAQIYSRIQGGVEAVWTAFRDIAINKGPTRFYGDTSFGKTSPDSPRPPTLCRFVVAKEADRQRT